MVNGKSLKSKDKGAAMKNGGSFFSSSFMLIVQSLSLSLFPDCLTKNHLYEKVFIIVHYRNVISLL